MGLAVKAFKCYDPFIVKYMKRFVDRAYYDFSTFAVHKEGITVCCPKCAGMGAVTLADDLLHFKCTRCGQRQSKSKFAVNYDAHSRCEACGRYYRTDITNEKERQQSALYTPCPYCGALNQGKVHATKKRYWSYGEIEGGSEPYFGYPLYFQSTFGGKLIWAVNREHLQYLIDYLEADLREEPGGYRGMCQADHLPAFMKRAKNRSGIVKTLRKMQL
jgi:hypothetical protein